MREYKKGGYAIIDLASTTIYKDALDAVASNKPVVVYDLPNVYFADTIKVATIDDDKVVVITKGGKTITINDANAVSSEGDIQGSLYTYEFEISGKCNYEIAHEIRFMFNSNKKLTDDNVISYFANFAQNVDWTFIGEDFETNGLVAINTINSTKIFVRDFVNNKDVEFDLTSEDVTISLYPIN